MVLIILKETTCYTEWIRSPGVEVVCEMCLIVKLYVPDRHQQRITRWSDKTVRGFLSLCKTVFSTCELDKE